MIRRARVSALSLVLATLASVSCAGRESRASAEAVAQLETATDAARASKTYHVTAVISGDSSSVESIFGGTHEIDVQKPDRLRTVRKIGSKEAQRTVAIGNRVFSSHDGGKTWDEQELPGITSMLPTVLDQLERVCTIKGSLPRLEVSVRSPSTGCDDPQVLFVTLEGGVIDAIEMETPTKEGTVSAILHFDFDRAVNPITEPTNSVLRP